jgi:anaerobic magnesium-protoporphyrin IX monomethyl ester cyclase
MTFQRRRRSGSRRSSAGCVRRRIVAGGYDPSLAPDAYGPPADVDIVVRGEGELTFNELLRGVEALGDGVVDRRAVVPAPDGLSHNPDRHVEAGLRRWRCPIAERACSRRLHLPRPAGGRRRDLARMHVRLQLLLDHRDAGPQLPPYPIDRVLADIADARRHGARAIFLVDDNITLDVRASSALRSHHRAGLNDSDYIVQA